MSKRILKGLVVSNKMDKTAVVKVERRFTHPLFQKVIQRSKKYKVHDEKNSAVVGDIVTFVETKPISKHKSFTLLNKDSLK